MSDVIALRWQLAMLMILMQYLYFLVFRNHVGVAAPPVTNHAGCGVVSHHAAIYFYHVMTSV